MSAWVRFLSLSSLVISIPFPSNLWEMLVTQLASATHGWSTGGGGAAESTSYTGTPSIQYGITGTVSSAGCGTSLWIRILNFGPIWIRIQISKIDNINLGFRGLFFFFFNVKELDKKNQAFASPISNLR